MSTEHDTNLAVASPALPQEAAWGVRMRDFLTDGSVAALCDELSRLAGVPVWLRDQNGEAIIPVWSDSHPDPGGSIPLDADRDAGHPASLEPSGGHPWSIVTENVARQRAFGLVGWNESDPVDAYAVPLRISTGLLGHIVTCLPRRSGDSTSTAEFDGKRLSTVRRGLLLLASSVCDVCEAQVALRKRVRELDALYHLSSVLTAAGDERELLSVALDLAADVLRADAGTISVFDDNQPERPLVTRASRGLSPDFAADTRALGADGRLRQSVLDGEIVFIEDLLKDSRVSDHARVEREGLRTLISTGLLDQGRALGVIRLFSRRPRVFTQAEGELLTAIAGQLAAAITKHKLRALRSEDERVKRQVRLAADVQRRMLPRSVPMVHPFDVAAHYAPSFELGGDFYDFLELGGNLGILIGDVVGKGVPAALLMSAVRASVRAHAQDIYHIDEVLSRVNKALCRDTLDNEFATVWYGVADPQTLRLTYCGAGHDWPLLVRVPRDRTVEDRDVQRLTADGMALGIDPTQKYPKGTFQLQPRDVLVTFTDGLHDATDFQGKRFGGTRLRKAVLGVLASEPEASASRIVEHVIAQVRQHSGISGRTDDITIVVLRVGEKNG